MCVCEREGRKGRKIPRSDFCCCSRITLYITAGPFAGCCAAAPKTHGPYVTEVGPSPILTSGARGGLCEITSFRGRACPERYYVPGKVSAGSAHCGFPVAGCTPSPPNNVTR